ncbi:phenylacetate--CoA ligase family protein [Nocardia aurantiaca]|uniref:AMP-binding protein n=1 Tax=Nocardia aurantiaca TaxID=2675850 RepID=A0A6I3L041_9NOCA|nr:phenylacetate--CoA ligase family protein [Nocardia aurantiaca]MTE15652.1 AMP-binding protein [Nocardia aurantiaca]
MLISNANLLATLLDARDSVKAHLGREYSSEYYDRRLGVVWDRAREAKAYRHLPEYEFVTFGEQPLTAKEDIKETPWDFIVADPANVAKYYETTGTTGRVTPTPRTADDIIWNTVAVAEAWREVLRDDDRVAILLPSDVVPVADLIAGVCEYRGIPHTRNYPFTTGISDWDRLLGLWDAFRPTVLFAAPGVVLQLSRLLQNRGVLQSVSEQIRAIMLLGEVSTPALRERLGSWWEAAVFDASYGSTETGTLAVACGQGQQHLMTATNYFELATEAGVSALDSVSSGTLVVTPLNLFARPLLRLDTGDEVSVDRGCLCGNLAPTVTVHGRKSDAIAVAGHALDIRSVENIVYGATAATGYLIEVAADGSKARILLERRRSADSHDDAEQLTELHRRSKHALGIAWSEALFVNTLPITTKSGGSQKSWKRSNIRVVEGL